MLVCGCLPAEAPVGMGSRRRGRLGLEPLPCWTCTCQMGSKSGAGLRTAVVTPPVFCAHFLFPSSCPLLSESFRTSIFCSVLLIKYNSGGCSGCLVTGGRIRLRAAAGLETGARQEERCLVGMAHTLLHVADEQSGDLKTFPVPASCSLYIPACHH